MRRAWLPLVLALVAPLAARGETIYAVAGGIGDIYLLRFDSATPWVTEVAIPLGLDFGLTLEFDPQTQALYGFVRQGCPIDPCPPVTNGPVIIDPHTGDWSFVDWPGFEAVPSEGSDSDIHPLTREIRSLAVSNYRYSLNDLMLHVDEPLDIPLQTYGIAHTPPVEGGGGVETYAIGYAFDWEDQLFRVGGPGGIPPASSGEVALIGQIELGGIPTAFDISAGGVAYFSTYDSIEVSPGEWEEVHFLYTIDLGSGATTLIGKIATPDPQGYVSGIAVAPPGLGAGVLEIPALSRLGLAAFALLVAGLAFSRVRARRHLCERRVDAG